MREFYPEHVFDEELFTSRPKLPEGDWWTREAEKPTPDTCKPPSWLGKHPSGGDWCQHCGWRVSQ